MESYLQEIREDIQAEKRSFNALQAEQMKQKKAYDELRLKSKNCSRLMAGAQTDMSKLDEMAEELKAKSEYVNELEGCLMDKNKELARLNQAFLK